MLVTCLPIKKVSAETLTTSNVVHIENSGLNYNGTIETIYADCDVFKYRITEFGDTFDVIIDRLNGLVYINNYELTINDYLNLNSEQINQLKTRTSGNISMLDLATRYEENIQAVNEYEILHKQYQTAYANHFHENSNLSRCMECSLNTTTVPTTGYTGSEINAGSSSTLMEIAATAACNAALASYCTWGLGAVASAIINGFLEAVGVLVASTQVSYHKFQTLHSVCWNAIKERRLIWLKDTLTNKDYSTNKYHYFYINKPY